MAATTTYLQIVNAAIQEAGVDLASFASDGSDFLTNPTAMMQRFRVWVSRAWKDIQQQCYDWDFMQEQGVCNLDPGIMFYTNGAPVSMFANNFSYSKFNIYDQDGTVALPNVSAGAFTDLTGIGTVSLPFGYFNFSGLTQTQPLQIALKPGAEYFIAPEQRVFGLTTNGPFNSLNPPGPTNTDIPINWINNVPSTANLANPILAKIVLAGVTYPIGLYYAGTSTSGGSPYGYTILAYCNTDFITAIDTYLATANVTVTFTDFYSGDVLLSFQVQNNTSQFIINTTGPFTTTYNAAKAFVHSWKSFDFNEEIQSGDFQELIQEIDQTSFRLVDYLAGAPQGEQDLEYVHWESFRKRFDLSAAYPGLPRLISCDDTDRYRFYPAPYYRTTVKFDYARTPQVLTAFGDTPRGINNDFVDLIMWKALIYYGKFDEQPSVAARSREEFSNILSRLKQKNTDKVHFKPARLF